MELQLCHGKYHQNVGEHIGQQAISAHDQALCQLTLCFKFQSRSESTKG